MNVTHESRLKHQRTALGSRPVGRPFVQGQAPFLTQTSTGAQLAAGRQVGLAHHRKNSFKRVNPFTRFTCSLRMVFKHNDSGQKCTVFLGENVGSHQVQQVGVFLAKNSTFSAPPQQYNLLARLMRGLDHSRFGWSLHSVSLPTLNYPISIDTARKWFDWFGWTTWIEDSQWNVKKENLSDFLQAFPDSSPEFFYYVLDYKQKVHNFYDSL